MTRAMVGTLLTSGRSHQWVLDRALDNVAQHMRSGVYMRSDVYVGSLRAAPTHSAKASS